MSASEAEGRGFKSRQARQKFWVIIGYMVEYAYLVGLFVASFSSATILPGTSELTFLYLLKIGYSSEILITVATIGNTLGGMTSYLLGLGVLRFSSRRNYPWLTEALRKRGPVLLIFSWVPFVGDIFCLGAGWLRFNLWSSLLMMAIGKGLRYWWLAIIFESMK